MSDHIHQHPSAETIQAFLEGELPGGERSRIEEHLASCARCGEEVDGWRLLYAELDELPALRPSGDFARRVMEEVEVPRRLSLVARVRQALGSLLPDSDPHLPGERIQDLVEGVLPARQAARSRAHLDGCEQCAGRERSWRTVMEGLDALGHLEPSEAFAERVMAGVRVPAAAPTARKVPAWKQALAAAWGLVPKTRRAWAAVSGVAVTPAVIVGLVGYAVFSHPTLTLGALVSFAWWKATALATVLWDGVATMALESAGAFQLYSMFESLAAAPAAVAGGFLLFSAATAAAVWILYKNLIATHPVDGRISHA